MYAEYGKVIQLKTYPYVYVCNSEYNITLSYAEKNSCFLSSEIIPELIVWNLCCGARPLAFALGHRPPPVYI